MVLVIAMATSGLAGEVYAERAMWVWGMADNIVLDDPEGSRAEFFTFCDAPHSNTDKAITTVYLSGTAGGKDLVTSFAEELRGFLSAAHARGLRIECLDGDKYWALPDFLGVGDNRARGEARIDEILAFNAAGSQDAERFDGIHYDVEPHGLSYSRGDDYDWDADNAFIWSEYLVLLGNCRGKIDAYNASNTDIEFGVDIAFWYDDYDNDAYPGGVTDILNYVDYVGIMDYRDSASRIVDGASYELGLANDLDKRVYIGIETAPAYEPDPPSITFYEEGNDFMEGELETAEEQVNSNSSFAGFAIHFYEDIDRGQESYRSLWMTTPRFRPTVKVYFPNGDEGIDFMPGASYDIRWSARDEDSASNSLIISLHYSSNGGSSWSLIASAEPNDGVYTWDTTGIPEGDSYRVKVTARDFMSLSGYGISDYNFAFSGTPSELPEWADPRATGVNGVRPILIPDGDLLHMVYYWPGWAGMPRAVYYQKSANKGSTWSAPVTLASNDVSAPRKPAMAVRGNMVAVVWVQGSGANGAKAVLARVSNDAGETWEDAQQIQGDYSGFKWADFPDVVIDEGNNIHAVWSARSLAGPWVVHYNTRQSFSNSWLAARTTLTSTSYAVSTPAITSEAANNVHVVWGEFNWAMGNKCFIRHKQGFQGNWPAATIVSSLVVSDDIWTKYFPDIYVDETGTAHCVWYVGLNPSNDSAPTPPIDSRIYYNYKLRGFGWQTTYSNIARGYTPKLSSSGGEMRVVYFKPVDVDEKGSINYKSTNMSVPPSWSAEGTISDDARMPYWNSDCSVMVGFPHIASDSSGNMVSCWRGYSSNEIMLSYKGVFSPPNELFANLIGGTSELLRLTWREPSGYVPNSYSVYRSVDGGNFSLIASDIYGLEHIDSDLSDASYYRYLVTATEGTLETGFSGVSNAIFPGRDNFLLDWFEGYEQIQYRKAGSSELDWSINTSIVKEGSQSMKIEYTYVGPPETEWGAALAGSLPTTYNILSYNSVKFWARGGAAGGDAIKIQLFETGKPEGNEIWESPAASIVNTGWAEYEYKLSDFVKVDSVGGNGNFRMDKGSISSYGMSFGPDTPNGTYYIDEIRLLRQAGEVSVPQSSYSFGPDPLEGSIDDYRFVTESIPITFGGFSPPWTLRIWTDNVQIAPGPNQASEAAKWAGLIGKTRTDQVIPLKVWCANFGPSESVPDEDNDYFFTGYDFGDGVNIGRQFQDGDKEDLYTSGTFDETYWGFDINGDGDAKDQITASPGNKVGEEPSWLRIPENEEMNPMNEWTWRRLTYAPGAEMLSPLYIYLAIDVNGKSNQVYETTTLTIEYFSE